MVQIAICDDDIEILENLKALLLRYCPNIFPEEISYQVKLQFHNATELLKYMKNGWIDVLFLDIYMPDLTGFEVSKKLVKLNPDIRIIYISEYDHFVYEAFEYYPFAYLRKERLSLDLPRTLHRLAEQFFSEQANVTVNSVEGKQKIIVRKILYIKSQGNYYVLVQQGDRELSCRGTMRDAEALFEQYGFVRTHAAYIVNLLHINHVKRTYVSVGKRNERIPISYQRFPKFKQKYDAYTERGLRT